MTLNRHERLTRDVLLFGLIPAWVAAGVVDWWCHRRTRIEDNAGLPESLSHVAMLVQAGVPLTLGLFLEADAPLLVLTYAGTVTHTATAYWDVGFAAPRREITPLEQHTHAFLEVLPIAGAAFLTVLHPGQTRELFSGKAHRWRLRPKRHPLGPGYVAGLLATLGVALALPAEEVLRCARAASRRRREGVAARTPVPPAPELSLTDPLPALDVATEPGPAGRRPTEGADRIP